MTEMMPVKMNGRWDMLLPEHRALRPEWTTGWEADHLDSMHANLRPGDVVYDVGAEEGDMSALYASWVKGSQPVHGESAPVEDRRYVEPDGCRCDPWNYDQHLDPGCRYHDVPAPGREGTPGGVVLIEPNDRVWPNIKAIFDANGLDAPIACWPGFASEVCSPYGQFPHGWPPSVDGPLIGDHGFKSLVESELSLPNITLDQIANETGRAPSGITIDVEGAELRVLYGAKQIVANDRPLLWISVHQAMLEYDYQTTSEDLHWWLGDQGYVGRQLERGHEHIWFYAPRERAGDVVW